MRTKITFLISLLFLTPSISKAQTWEFVGPDSIIVNQIYVSSDTIYTGTSMSNGVNIKPGLYFSSNSGSNWIQLDSALENNNVYGFQVVSPGTLFMLKAGTLYKTTNHGGSWEVINNISNNPIVGFRISPLNVSEMYCLDLEFIGGGTFNNLYKSTDGGENWETLGPFPASSHGNALTFTMDLTDSMNLYVGVDDHWTSLYLYKSTDKGENWVYITSLPLWPKAILTDYIIPNRLYTVSGPYISNEGGLNWFLADSGLTDTSYSISIYQERSTTNLYILRSDGIYYSGNEIVFWNLMKESKTLPIDFLDMRTMFIESISKELFLGTRHGIYRTTITTSVNESEIKSLHFSLNQNYPNPFNPSTTIEYQVNKSSFVSIKVFDILGNRIITLVSEERAPGKYKLVFNGEKLTSGVYFYVLTVETEQGEIYTEGKKMLLIK